MAGFNDLLLCATGDDNAAVRYVAQRAAATSADLTIADIIEDRPPLARRRLPPSWNLAALVRKQNQARLESSAALAASAANRQPSHWPDPDQGTCPGSSARRT
jgi:hypothetical protein